MKAAFSALTVLLAASLFAVDWDHAQIVGTTPYGRIFYEPNEEMLFTLRLLGVKEELPADTYFVDWERRGDDGVIERGRAPLPFPSDGLVLKAKSGKPGFVCIEANVVTKDGRRVPKNHRWEKRVFFQGGACVRPNEIPQAREPDDYESFWSSCLNELDAVPIKAEIKSVSCPDPLVRLYSVRIACAGPCPVTGYLTIPTAASTTNRMPICANFRGASQDEQLPPTKGPHDRIDMTINPNGYELGRGPEYVKRFLAEVSQPGYGYGFGPLQNEHKDTSYWKWCALRAIRYVQWIKTLPEWDGRTLELRGGSQGDWQCYHAAARVSGVSHIAANGSWGCDWTGQAEYNRLTSTYRPKCWFPDMAYFDPVFAAKRLTCPVDIAFCGLGDYVATPASLTLVYRNLKGPKRITYVQGSTHGWRPSGVQRFTVEAGFEKPMKGRDGIEESEVDPFEIVRKALVRGERHVVVPKSLYYVKPKSSGAYLHLKGVSDVTIDFSGSELRGLENVGFFRLDFCTNVTIRNVTLDYQNLPFTQARIVSNDRHGSQLLQILDGYPQPPANRTGDWPFQVYDKDSLELKNPMRSGNGFCLQKVGDGLFRVSGGRNRCGEIGDIAVWSMPSVEGSREGDHVSERDVVHSRNSVHCVFEDITEYSTPGGRAFEEHLAEGNVYRRCRIERRPAEFDFATRSVKRLRSGNHDAFMSRRSVVGPKLIDCVATHHCDDAVNISGMYGVVYSVTGNVVRLLEYIPSVFSVGDMVQAMSSDGRKLPEMKVLCVRSGLEMSSEEKSYMDTIGLWPGISRRCQTAVALRLDNPQRLNRGDVVISNRAQGNGFEIRGCRFGQNRAFGIRLRASHGVIADTTIDHPEGYGIFIGPEYEWLEGGQSEDVLIASNVFVGCGLHVGGSAAHRQHLFRESYPSVRELGNVFKAKTFSLPGRPIEWAKANWIIPEGGSRDGDVLTIRQETKGTSLALANIDLTPYSGKCIVAKIRVSAENLKAGPRRWLGYKFMLSYTDETRGECLWPSAPCQTGTFDWRESVLKVDLRGRRPEKAKLSLGIQDSSGIVRFDLASLKIQEDEPLFPENVSKSKCVYSHDLSSRRIGRGVMLPARNCTEDDFKTLKSWGVTLARYQMIRNWGKICDNSDPEEFAAWVCGKIDHLLNDVLAWAELYDIDIVVDLHVGPGGVDGASEMVMFHDPRYARSFVEVWREIARRCKGQRRIWGYDLINEPFQITRSSSGDDYWTLQVKAAKAIREIDSKTPIVMESNCACSPATYGYLGVSDLENVIYQVHVYVPTEFTHQGVHADSSSVRRLVPYPNVERGWDREWLKRSLKPVRDFQLRHDARIYVGEFSAIAWAPGAEKYLNDCISLFEKYGWDWTYHAFREWPGWSVEHAGADAASLSLSENNPRKRVLLSGFFSGNRD